MPAEPTSAVPPAAPAAVLFDLDGTLVNSEPINVESVVLAVRRHGRELGPEERHFVIGHSWNEIHALIAQRCGLDVSMDTLIAEAVEEKRVLVARAGLPVLPGAVAAVRRLQARAPLAVVSGASRVEVQEAVEGLGVRDAFSFLLGAEDYQRGKPDPEPYLLAIARFGVPAARCVVIEDATPGILAARAAGTRVIAVRAGNYAGYDLSAAHVVVDTLDDVTDQLIGGLLAGPI
jgi:HAD superfamily hydrolase (TIGR01509 family)